MDWLETKSFLGACFPDELRDELELLIPGELREIRIRADRPTVFCTASRTMALNWRPGKREVETLAEAITDHSLYARTDETSQGYVTLEGGHRMGICGQVTFRDGKTELRDFGSLCIRIACQWPGSADTLIPFARHGGCVQSMLIIGAPGTGKTTLLRDLARQLASGSNAIQTAVIDERGELAASVGGVPQLNVGEWTDVLDGSSKQEGVSWLIRSMSPQLIVTDELSGAEDAGAVMEALSCGVSIIASVHGHSLNDVASRPSIAALMSRRCFSYYVVLSHEGGGQIDAIFDRSGSPVKFE